MVILDGWGPIANLLAKVVCVTLTPKEGEEMSEWVKIRSWHIVSTWTRVPGRSIALCGKTADWGTPLPAPPEDEKTCETCFRRRERKGLA